MKYHLVLGLCLELVEGEVRPRGGLGRGKAMLPKIAAHLQTLNGLSPQAYACVEKAENLRACFTAPRVEGSRLRFLLVAGSEQEGQKDGISLLQTITFSHTKSGPPLWALQHSGFLKTFIKI